MKLVTETQRFFDKFWNISYKNDVSIAFLENVKEKQEPRVAQQPNPIWMHISKFSHCSPKIRGIFLQNFLKIFEKFA